MTSVRIMLVASLAALGAACGRDTTSPVPPVTSAGCTAPPFTPVATPARMTVLGQGVVSARYTAEVTARGDVAYTTSWGRRASPGNAVYVWDVKGNAPTLVDSAIVAGATTTGDVAVSDDGRYLFVATEPTGTLVVYDLADPRHPRQLTQFSTPNTINGVHTAEIGRVNGKPYGFLAIDPRGGAPARLTIVELSTPTSPREVYSRVIGNPYVHDTFVRDGLLFLALWDDGVEIWDVGGGRRGGTPEAPVVLGRSRTVGGQAHNVWWFQDRVTGCKRYAFVGQEGPAAPVLVNSSGDIHVLDVSDPSAPREVAFFTVPGAGTHNFSVDEENGILYAAYYNGGVRALDVRGDLSTCDASAQVTAGGVTRCDLRRMGREIGQALVSGSPQTYVWGVHYQNGVVYASDMLNGIWKLQALTR